jgi:hypothetical protein
MMTDEPQIVSPDGKPALITERVFLSNTLKPLCDWPRTDPKGKAKAEDEKGGRDRKESADPETRNSRETKNRE